MNIKAKINEARKAAVAVVTAISTALAFGLVPDEYVGWATVLITTAGSIGVYAVKNVVPE